MSGFLGGTRISQRRFKGVPGVSGRDRGSQWVPRGLRGGGGSRRLKGFQMSSRVSRSFSGDERGFRDTRRAQGRFKEAQGSFRGYQRRFCWFPWRLRRSQGRSQAITVGIGKSQRLRGSHGATQVAPGGLRIVSGSLMCFSDSLGVSWDTWRSQE